MVPWLSMLASYRPMPSDSWEIREIAQTGPAIAVLECISDKEKLHSTTTTCEPQSFIRLEGLDQM